MNTFAKNLEMRGNVTSGMDRISDVPRVSVYRAAATSPASGTPTAIAWDTQDYASEAMWNSSSPTRLTVITAGVYDFKATGGFVAGSVGFRQVYIRKNGTDPYGVLTTDFGVSGSNLTTSWQIPMNAGDYVEAVFSQNQGVAQAFGVATASSRVNGFQGCLIST